MKKFLIVVMITIFIITVGAFFVLKSVGLLSRSDYDEVPPEIPVLQRPAILVLSKTNGYVHEEALPAGEAMLKKIAKRKGWAIYTTKNAATHNSEDLDKFDVIVWNNVSGDVLTPKQKKAFKSWIEAGGGWIGMHASGGDIFYQWDWYVDTLIGARFVGHTFSPQFQDAKVLKTDLENIITFHLPSSWEIKQEEWYAFESNPRHKGYNILLTMDTDSYQTKGKTLIWQDDMEGEHPITWMHELGKGRVFYTAIGHTAKTYETPEFEQMIENAITWGFGK